LVNYGNQLLIKSKLDAAIVEYRKALPLGERRWLVHYQLGLAYQLKGDINEALSEFAHAAEQSAPSDKKALIAFQQGQLLTRLGRCAEAVELSDKALAGLADNDNRIAALGSMAQCHIRLAMPAQAVDDYRRILQIEPDRRSAKIGLAMAMNRNGQAEAALQILDELIAQRDAAELRLARALTFRTMNRRDAMAKEVEAGLKLDPASPLLLGLKRDLESGR
jgi:tetratricopeptide (TPR) repeat protein